jgi:dTDP-4-amino-4,6-dideoxygalactose transaminase
MRYLDFLTKKFTKQNLRQDIPYIDFTREYKNIEEEIDKTYKEIMNRGWYILGPEVSKFEKEFANYCGVKYAIGVASGIDALSLVLNAWGIGPGDEAIVPANTYIATAFAATHNRAKPVFVDIDPKSFNIDVHQIEKAITEKTRVIMPTHLYGQMANMGPILELAKKYNLKILEDAAQAHGAKQNNKICGGHGSAVAFSFYPTKNLGCYGDGGAITTNDQSLYEILLHLRNNGSKTKYYYDYVGYNSRLDELQAGFLSVKLKYLDEWNAKREELAKHYLRELQEIDEIILPSIDPQNTHTWHVFCIRVLNGKREELMEHLKAHSIGFNIHYPLPPHLQNCYTELDYTKGSFLVAEQVSEEILSLPLTPFHRVDEIVKIISVIKNFYKK